MIYVAVVGADGPAAVTIQKACAVYFRNLGKRVSCCSYDSSFPFLRDWQDGKRDFDILFLSGAASGREAVQMAEKIREKKTDFALIFLSDSEEYMKAAFRLGALHYLPAHPEEEEVREALRRAAQMTENSWHKTIVFKSGSAALAVELSDLEAVVSSDHQQTLCLKTGREISLRVRLSEIEEQLKERSRFAFVSSCRGVLVNLDEVAELRGDKVILRSGRVLPIAKRRFGEMKRIVSGFMENGTVVS